MRGEKCRLWLCNGAQAGTIDTRRYLAIDKPDREKERSGWVNDGVECVRSVNAVFGIREGAPRIGGDVRLTLLLLLSLLSLSQEISLLCLYLPSIHTHLLVCLISLSLSVLSRSVVLNPSLFPLEES